MIPRPESDGYGISSGSGYDIYAPLSTPLYGRLRAQLHTNAVSSSSGGGKLVGINAASRTGMGKSKNGVTVNGSNSNNNGASGKNNGSGNNAIDRMAAAVGGGGGGGNYRTKNRLEALAYERTERYASSWD